jgi:hypothetical protein
MERLGAAKIWSFLDGNSSIQEVSNRQIRQDPGLYVSSYLEMAAKIAELQFRNRDHVLFFRGQQTDHKSTQGSTSLKASMFRPLPRRTTLPATLLKHRYDCLAVAEKMLADAFETLSRTGRTRVQRQRLLRWAILQHYEVCPTPLLDVTQSLRIGASFGSDPESQEAFLFALAVPNVSGAITASAEAGLQIVRLASVCPPAALRPHIQEGYLLGEYPDLSSVSQKDNYKAYQLDFGQRLIGKFRFRPASFWHDDNFPRVQHAALYPQSKDWLENATDAIRIRLASLK